MRFFRNVDVDTSIQRKGRTARFCDGLYVLLQAVDKTPFLPYPTAVQAFENDELCHKYYKFENKLQPLPPNPLNINSYVILLNTKECRDNYDSLKLFYQILSNERQYKKAVAIYRQMERGINNAQTEFYFTRCFFKPSPWNVINEILLQNPYHCLIDGQWTSATSIIMTNGVITTGSTGLKKMLKESKRTTFDEAMITKEAIQQAVKEMKSKKDSIVVEEALTCNGQLGTIDNAGFFTSVKMSVMSSFKNNEPKKKEIEMKPCMCCYRYNLPRGNLEDLKQPDEACIACLNNCKIGSCKINNCIDPEKVKHADLYNYILNEKDCAEYVWREGKRILLTEELRNIIEQEQISFDTEIQQMDQTPWDEE